MSFLPLGNGIYSPPRNVIFSPYLNGFFPPGNGIYFPLGNGISPYLNGIFPLLKWFLFPWKWDLFPPWQCRFQEPFWQDIPTSFCKSKDTETPPGPLWGEKCKFWARALDGKFPFWGSVPQLK